jgi:hypothetical protein
MVHLIAACPHCGYLASIAIEHGSHLTAKGTCDMAQAATLDEAIEYLAVDLIDEMNTIASYDAQSRTLNMGDTIVRFDEGVNNFIIDVEDKSTGRWTEVWPSISGQDAFPVEILDDTEVKHIAKQIVDFIDGE